LAAVAASEVTSKLRMLLVFNSLTLLRVLSQLLQVVVVYSVVQQSLRLASVVVQRPYQMVLVVPQLVVLEVHSIQPSYPNFTTLLLPTLFSQQLQHSEAEVVSAPRLSPQPVLSVSIPSCC